MSRANAGGVGPGRSPRITRLVKRRASANPSLSCKAGEPDSKSQLGGSFQVEPEISKLTSLRLPSESRLRNMSCATSEF
jgi:hypothetical protein